MEKPLLTPPFFLFEDVSLDIFQGLSELEKKITANTTLPPLTSNQTDSRFGWKLVYLLFNGECQCSYP